MCELSIIIINYNTGQLVRDCVKSIILQTNHINYEIILIDNASTEPIAPFLEDFKGINLILNESNIGFGRANNQGIEVANGEYVLLLNSDTIILNHAIEKTLAYLKSKVKTGLASCMLLNEDRSIQKSIFSNLSAISMIFSSNPFLSRLYKSRIEIDYKETQFVHAVSGAFMLLRKEVFDKVKGFDPDFFMYSEETELCRNRISKYYDIEYFADAQVVHLEGKSAPRLKMYHQAMLSYALVWYKKGWDYYILYMLVCLLNLISLPVAYIFAGSNGRKDISKQFRGYMKILPYMIFDIPRFKASWGSRPNSLKLR